MRTHMKEMLAIAALSIAFGMGTQARAVDITFDLTSGVSGTSFSKTVSGYTLTFSNPSASPEFFGSSDGLLIGRLNPTSSTGTRGFDIQLSGGQPGDFLIFKSYEVGRILETGANPFSLTGGTGTSTNNSLASPGVFNFNGPFSIAQGQTVSFFAPYTQFVGGNLSFIKSMTLTVVPEPSTYALGGIGTLTMAWLARRRKAKA